MLYDVDYSVALLKNFKHKGSTKYVIKNRINTKRP